MVKLRKRPWAEATLLVVASVLVGTLWPWSFVRDPRGSAWELLTIGIGPDLGADVLGNALLFVPLGIALSGLLHSRQVGRWAIVTSVLGVSLGFSYAIEMLQHFIPGRVSSLSDILANGAGAGLGFVVHSWYRGEQGPLNVVAYGIAVILLSLPLQWATTIRDWDRDVPLVVGNEHRWNRPWHGQVFAVSILDRAVAAADVPRMNRTATDLTRVADAEVASYDLAGPCPCVDLSGHLPPLILRGHFAAEGFGGEARTGTLRWLETPAAADYVVDRVNRTSAFTVAVTAATADTQQWGPARVVSLSDNPYRGNFTVGQRGSDLVFQFRTLLTGDSGDRPSLDVPGVFSTQATRHVVVTYDGLDLVAYIDGARSPHSVRFGLGAGAFAPYLGRDSKAYYLYDIAYCALVFIPAGLLISRMAMTGQRKALRIAALAGWVIICSLSFEAILVAASGRPVNVSNPLWGVLFSGGVVAKNRVMDEKRVHERSHSI